MNLNTPHLIKIKIVRCGVRPRLCQVCNRDLVGVQEPFRLGIVQGAVNGGCDVEPRSARSHILDRVPIISVSTHQRCLAPKVVTERDRRRARFTEARVHREREILLARERSREKPLSRRRAAHGSHEDRSAGGAAAAAGRESGEQTNSRREHTVVVGGKNGETSQQSLLN
ncbi:hypothetical protein FI667_g7153, partial [Globisporangium splendens]